MLVAAIAAMQLWAAAANRDEDVGGMKELEVFNSGNLTKNGVFILTVNIKTILFIFIL